MILEELGSQLELITINIDDDGEINVNIPSTVIATLGNTFPILLEAIENVSITRISLSLVVLDTYISIDDITLNATIYLTETDNGFTGTYNISYDGAEGIITFDVNKS